MHPEIAADDAEPQLDPKYLAPYTAPQPPVSSAITPGVVRPPSKGSPPAAPPGRTTAPQTVLMASYLPKT